MSRRASLPQKPSTFIKRAPSLLFTGGLPSVSKISKLDGTGIPSVCIKVFNELNTFTMETVWLANHT